MKPKTRKTKKLNHVSEARKLKTRFRKLIFELRQRKCFSKDRVAGPLTKFCRNWLRRRCWWSELGGRSKGNSQRNSKGDSQGKSKGSSKGKSTRKSKGKSKDNSKGNLRGTPSSPYSGKPLSPLGGIEIAEILSPLGGTALSP